MAGRKTILIAAADGRDRKSLVNLLNSDYNILETDVNTSAISITEANISTVTAVILDINFNIQYGLSLLVALKKSKIRLGFLL